MAALCRYEKWGPGVWGGSCSCLDFGAGLCHVRPLGLRGFSLAKTWETAVAFLFRAVVLKLLPVPASLRPTRDGTIATLPLAPQHRYLEVPQRVRSGAGPGSRGSCSGPPFSQCPSQLPSMLGNHLKADGETAG